MGAEPGQGKEPLPVCGVTQKPRYTATSQTPRACRGLSSRFNRAVLPNIEALEPESLSVGRSSAAHFRVFFVTQCLQKERRRRRSMAASDPDYAASLSSGSWSERAAGSRKTGTQS